MAIYTCGHKIPDSDSICSAISLAYLLNKLGRKAVPARQGELNPESRFILETFGHEAPMLKTSFANEELYIVDYSDLAQAPDDINEANIIGIVDHHKLGDITTSSPLECWIRPLGCSSTVLKQMYDFYKIDIPKDIAGLMLGAILSDTIIFKSPTCTQDDIKAVRDLAKLAKIDDFKAFGMKMFEIKSQVENASASELVKRDYKDFNMHGQKIGIGQLELIDASVLDERHNELKKELELLRQEEGLHTAILLLTDIMKEGSTVLVSSNQEDIFEKAFNVKLEASTVWLDACLSRKKQIIPFLEPAFK